ncbi:hypothetical protein E0494_09905 [Marinilabiliaceae bacterium JC040]|nr:hypothetical protein [Marinilabiliaceae bacterium JC040]
MKKILILILTNILILNIYSQNINKISLHRESSLLIKGKKVINMANCYYNVNSALIVEHSLSTPEYIRITKPSGEVKQYFPKENSLIQYQNNMVSSKRNDLYIYINNLYEDLGLSIEGFKMKSSSQEGELIVTEWLPSGNNAKYFLKAKIVYKNTMPIYMSIYKIDGSVQSKTYYSDYQIFGTLVLPMRVTDISYPMKNDSIIRRTIYSKVNLNHQVDDVYLNYKIPKNAKLLKNNPSKY